MILQHFFTLHRQSVLPRFFKQLWILTKINMFKTTLHICFSQRSMLPFCIWPQQTNIYSETCLPKNFFVDSWKLNDRNGSSCTRHMCSGCHEWSCLQEFTWQNGMFRYNETGSTLAKIIHQKCYTFPQLKSNMTRKTRFLELKLTILYNNAKFYWKLYLLLISSLLFAYSRKNLLWKTFKCRKSPSQSDMWLSTNRLIL